MNMTVIINPKIESKVRREPAFTIFKHNDLLCCIQRVMYFGQYCGYVAVSESHPFYGKDYSDHVIVDKLEEVPFNGNYMGLLSYSFADNGNMLSIDLALTVHGGVTYSKDHLHGIDKNVFGNLWWFGFDTAHSGDMIVFMDDIDRKYEISGDDYRTFDYVKDETKRLADQLSVYQPINEVK